MSKMSPEEEEAVQEELERLQSEALVRSSLLVVVRFAKTSWSAQCTRKFGPGGIARRSCRGAFSTRTRGT